MGSPKNYKRCRETYPESKNGYLRFINRAVSDKPGFVEFADSGNSGASVKGATTSHVLQNQKVPSVRLEDAMLGMWDSVALVKIDVQGHEPFAIRGMSRWLQSRAAPPFVIFEFGVG